MMDFDRRHALLAALIVLAAVGAVGAQTFLFTAGGGGTINATDGPAVTLGEDLGLTGSNPVGADGSVTIQDSTVDGPAGSSATLTAPSSSAPTLESIDTGGGTVEADTDGIQTVGIEGSISSITYRAIDLQDDQTTELDVSGSGTLHVHGFNAGDAIRVNRASGDATFVEADSAGVATITVSGGAELTLVADSAPVLSDPAPTGGGLISEPPIELSVDVTDADFDGGDNVTLEWYVDGDLEGTTYATENGTATFSSSTDTGGSHEWYVEAVDAANASAQSGGAENPHTFGLPNELSIYEETSPNTFIDSDNVNVTVRFFAEGSDDVIQRSPTGENATIDLQGLPADEEFIVTIDAEGYEYRRIIVDSLIEQQDVFLLPSDEESARVIFQLDDQTGRFSADSTRLYIERALNRSSGTRYHVIAGDRFGAGGEFPAPLQDDNRYRLRIENDQGETRTLGAYTTSGDRRVVLPIGTVEFTGDIDGGVGVDASLREAPPDASHNHEVRFAYIDEAGLTDSFSVTIETENGTTVRPETTETGPYGRYIETFPVTVNPEEETLYVQVEADRDGETVTFERALGDLPNIASDWEIDEGILQLFAWVSLIALMGLIVITNATIAAIVGVVYATLLVAVGILPIPGVALAAAGATAVLYRLGGDPV